MTEHTSQLSVCCCSSSSRFFWQICSHITLCSCNCRSYTTTWRDWNSSLNNNFRLEHTRGDVCMSNTSITSYKCTTGISKIPGERQVRCLKIAAWVMNCYREGHRSVLDEALVLLVQIKNLWYGNRDWYLICNTRLRPESKSKPGKLIWQTLVIDKCDPLWLKPICLS